MKRLFSTENVRYLQSPIQPAGLVALLMCVNLYLILTHPKPYPLAMLVAALEILVGGVLLLRKARVLAYALLVAALIIRVFVFVHVVANGSQDPQSTRDEAVETTAGALLHGENAWNANPGVGVTTGPTSILLALPFVLAFGQINWLSFAFWLLLLLALLWSDILHQNNTWPMLAMFFLLGWFDIEHTLYWSLEELYYPVLYLGLAYLLARRGAWWGVGALWAAALLSRPNYAVLVLGFALWLLMTYPFQWRTLGKLAVGFAAATILVLLPFVMIGGKDLLLNNPWRFALSFTGATWPDTNFVFHALDQLNTRIGKDAMRVAKLGATLAALLGFAWALPRRHISHPYWHLAAAGLIAHTVIWVPPQFSSDYTLMFALPALLAISMTTVQRAPAPTQATRSVLPADRSPSSAHGP